MYVFNTISAGVTTGRRRKLEMRVMDEDEGGDESASESESDLIGSAVLT